MTPSDIMSYLCDVTFSRIFFCHKKNCSLDRLWLFSFPNCNQDILDPLALYQEIHSDDMEHSRNKEFAVGTEMDMNQKPRIRRRFVLQLLSPLTSETWNVSLLSGEFWSVFQKFNQFRTFDFFKTWKWTKCPSHLKWVLLQS